MKTFLAICAAIASLALTERGTGVADVFRMRSFAMLDATIEQAIRELGSLSVQHCGWSTMAWRITRRSGNGY